MKRILVVLCLFFLLFDSAFSRALPESEMLSGFFGNDEGILSPSIKFRTEFRPKNIGVGDNYDDNELDFLSS